VQKLSAGNDWPHVTEKHKPDDAELFDLLTVWAGSASKSRYQSALSGRPLPAMNPLTLTRLLR